MPEAAASFRTASQMSESTVFRTPGETHLGVGAVRMVGPIARRCGARALLVTGARSAKASGALDTVSESLQEAGVEVVLYDRVGREPTLGMVDEARQLARESACDLIIGLGGGSPIDAAKAVAGLFFSPRPTAAHFEGRVSLPDKTLPWIAIPTTAGAGAEATPNSVLINEETKVKKSIRSWAWLAKAAIVDPALTVACPKSVTAASGMDAFTQAVESYTSRHATPLTEGISLRAALEIARGLPRAWEDGGDIEARTAVAWGATMAGIALANARLGAVHGLAHPVGTLCGLPHGLACGILLPAVIEFNLDVAAPKYARLARELGAAGETSSTEAAARAFLAYVRELNARLGVPASLGEAGLTREMIDEIVEQTLPSQSLAANPKPASREDLRAILLAQLE